MIVSVFGDVHGNIDLVYKSCRDWQRKHEKKIDLILQVGDLGIFGSEEAIDDTTKKRAEENPAELNLFNYLKNGNYAELLKGSDDFSTVKARLVFVDGNHDDHNYLDSLSEKYNKGRALVPVNEYLLYLRDAIPARIENGSTDISLAGIGGIDKENRPGQYEKKPKVAFTSDETTQALACEGVDIFLTHMYPVVEDRMTGSQELTDLVQLIQPKFFFFGHANKHYELRIGNTQCYGLNRVKHSNMDNLGDGSMLVLEKKGEKLEVINGA